MSALGRKVRKTEKKMSPPPPPGTGANVGGEVRYVLDAAFKN